MVLKTSVASRTLDNITAVLVSFKNFRKTLKDENGNASTKQLSDDKYKSQYLN
jgi:hypothetical protein